MTTFYIPQKWQKEIDARVSRGGALNFPFLDNLRTQYNQNNKYTMNWGHIAEYANRKGYQVSPKTARIMKEQMPKEQYTKLYIGASYAMPKDMKITDSVGGAAGSGRLVKGISTTKQDNLPSVPTVAQPKPRNPSVAPQTYNPRPLADLGGGGGGYDGSATPNPATPSTNPGDDIAQALRFGPGGPNSMLGGNALGFRRKRSSAQASGLSAKGTSQFKISGQTARSSGLNIGV